MTSFANSGERDDIPAEGFEFPLCERFLCNRKARKINLGRVAAPQGSSPEMIDDNEVSVDIFDFRRTLDKYSCVQISPHKSNSPYSLPEQGHFERANLNKSNMLLTVIDGPFTTLRRTDGTVSPLRERNDNHVPLDAA
jgi:hypothetical protein